jgi:hypothetical protein
LSIHMSSLVNLFMKELCRFETKLWNCTEQNYYT